MEESSLENRIENIKTWFKNPYNLAFAGIILLTIVIRLYYFILTKNQPLWWDEAEYMALAKNYAGIGNYGLSSIRLPGFQLLASLFFNLGITSEPILRFFLNFLPSIIAIILLYFVILEMYSDKRIALISVMIFGVLWESIFYSNRFHTENYAIIFQFIATIILFKVYMKKENLYFIKPKYSLIWIALLFFLAVIFRPTNAPFILSFMIFIIMINQSYLFSKKRKIPSMIGLILLAILLLYVYANGKQIPILNFYFNPELSPAWHFITSPFKGFLISGSSAISSILYYAFIIGFFMALIRVGMILDKVKEVKRDERYLEFKSDIYNLLLLITVIVPFIFVLRIEAIEFRWFFMILPSMLALTSKGMITFSNFIANFFGKKGIAAIIILIILTFGIYGQLTHTDTIIRVKLTSYDHVKDAGLWMKANSQESDIIVTQSVPQTAYYAEREVFFPNKKTEEEFMKSLEERNPKFVVISIYERPLDWTMNPSENFRNLTAPVQVYFMDESKTKPSLIIYEYKG